MERIKHPKTNQSAETFLRQVYAVDPLIFGKRPFRARNLDLPQLSLAGIGTRNLEDFDSGSEPSNEELDEIVYSGADQTEVRAVDNNYLHNISRNPLLDAAQEVKLAQAYEKGRLARERLNKLHSDNGTPTNLDEVRELKTAVNQGLAAKERLIVDNLRLVVSVARKYITNGGSLQLDDLIQEGNIGLIKGIDRFDWKRGFRISTYVYWWIRQAITKALAEQSRIIRHPVHMVELINKIFATQAQLNSELGRVPTSTEIAGRLIGVSAETIEVAMQSSKPIISLETPVGDERDSYLSDHIPDPGSNDPSNLATTNIQLEDLMEELTDRERVVLRLRFGVGDNPEAMSLEKVGKIVGVTRQRVNQIEAEALKKLRQKLIASEPG